VKRPKFPQATKPTVQTRLAARLATRAVRGPNTRSRESKRTPYVAREINVEDNIPRADGGGN